MKPAALQRGERGLEEDNGLHLSPGEEEATPRARQGRRHVPTQRIDWLILLLITVVGAWMVWAGAQFVRSDLASLQARYRIDNWQAGKTRWTYPDWLQARDDLRRAVGITPKNATLHEYLGMLHVLAGLENWSIPAARIQLYTEARQHQLRALELRPTHGLTWAHLARTEYALAPCPEAQWEAWRKALYFSPYEPVVQEMLADLAIACHVQAPQDVKDWLEAHHAQANAQTRKGIEAAALRYGVDRYKPTASSVPAGK